MASDLVLRLCQVDEADGGLPGAGKSPGEPGYDPQTAHIAHSDFEGGMWDMLGGYHSIATVKTNLNMSAAQQVTFDTLVSKVTDAPQMANRQGRIERIVSILVKWERQGDFPLAAYDSPDDIETQLLAIDTGF